MKKTLLASLSILFCVGCAEQIAKNPDQQRRQKYVNSHPEIDQRTYHHIIHGNIFVGMNFQEVIASIGDPYTVNRTRYEGGSESQWVYGSIYNPWTQIYVYFDKNGIVTAIQD